ncbi:MAG: hypothetical protein IBJ13_12770 [Sphingopyxis sp.]|nr:hypothetical protein [Sphingopyxis sp.]
MTKTEGIGAPTALAADFPWLALPGAKRPPFARLAAAGAPTLPATFRSRITCAARPKGVMLYIPFVC